MRDDWRNRFRSLDRYEMPDLMREIETRRSDPGLIRPEPSRRTTARTVLAAVVVVATALGAYGLWQAFGGGPGGPGSSGFFFPTWHPSGGPVPGALLKGHLVERDGCLLWDAGRTGEFLPLWPDSFTLTVEKGSPVVTTDVGKELHVGTEAALGGGERTRASAEEMIGREIPDQCAAPDYWLVVPGGP